jgi:uncharacterized protein YeaO (DUF488 family)
MLRQASVHEIKAGKIKDKDAHVVIAMHSFPRGVSKELFDEYVASLSPGPALFKDFYAHKRDKKEPHNDAFVSCNYERRFGVPAQGLGELKRLAALSATKDIYLVCQCKPDERCHRELLLMMAREWYGAKTEPLRFEYKLFAKRLLKKPPENLSFAAEASRSSRGLEWPVPLRD